VTTARESVAIGVVGKEGCAGNELKIINLTLKKNRRLSAIACVLPRHLELRKQQYVHEGRSEGHFKWQFFSWPFLSEADRNTEVQCPHVRSQSKRN
jgi:hypothetical protein